MVIGGGVKAKKKKHKWICASGRNKVAIAQAGSGTCVGREEYYMEKIREDQKPKEAETELISNQ